MVSQPAQSGLLSLGADFPPVGRDAWLAAVDKVLKGGDFEKRLVSQTYDGLRIDPLSAPTDWPSAADASGLPGQPPFTRGMLHALTGDGTAPAQTSWDIRQRHAHPDPAVANTQILADLERGVTSIDLALDLSALPSGQGIHTPDLDSLDQVLKGVLLDLAPVALTPADDGLMAASLLLAVWQSRGHRGTDVAGALNMDPLGALARNGRLERPLDRAIEDAAGLSKLVAEAYPRVTCLLADTRPYHDAGASEAQELAVALATGVAYLRALETAGLPMDAACQQVAFALSADTDTFLTIAKTRAMRRLWARVAEASGAGPSAQAARLHVETSSRMMSTRDPWVNILRTTIAAFGAALGGAESVTVLPFTAALGQPDSLARRIARNVQIILMEESGLGRVADPAGGAWALERLSDALAEKAWALFQEIEKDGGMAASLRSGRMAARIGDVAAARARDVATRRLGLTGVSTFPDLQEAQVALEPVDLETLTANARSRMKARRAAPQASNALAGLGRLGDAPAAEQAAALQRALQSGALVEDAAGTLTGTPEQMTPLPSRRLAAPFEALRLAADREAVRTGKRPAVCLLPLGTLAESTARTTFARSLYAAGGLDAEDPGPQASPKEAVDVFTRSGASIAVLCSSTDGYERLGPDTLKALHATGARHVVLAGRPTEMPEAARDEINRYIFAGCNVLEVLQEAHERVGILSAP